jgi:hypothetical protein
VTWAATLFVCTGGLSSGVRVARSITHRSPHSGAGRGATDGEDAPVSGYDCRRACTGRGSGVAWLRERASTERESDTGFISRRFPPWSTNDHNLCLPASASPTQLSDELSCAGDVGTMHADMFPSPVLLQGVSQLGWDRNGGTTHITSQWSNPRALGLGDRPAR